MGADKIAAHGANNPFQSRSKAMAENDEKAIYENTQRFLQLANELIKAGATPRSISSAIMTASCVCATQAALGNAGNLNETGINTISDIYKKRLTVVQERRKTAQARAKDARIKKTIEELVSFPGDE